jgi:hypothetical protein
LQLNTVEEFWKEIKIKETLGPYRPKTAVYANHLRSMLMDVDSEIFNCDNGYYWGSMIEGLQHGIVG